MNFYRRCCYKTSFIKRKVLLSTLCFKNIRNIKWVKYIICIEYSKVRTWRGSRYKSKVLLSFKFNKQRIRHQILRNDSLARTVHSLFFMSSSFISFPFISFPFVSLRHIYKRIKKYLFN